MVNISNENNNLIGSQLEFHSTWKRSDFLFRLFHLIVQRLPFTRKKSKIWEVRKNKHNLVSQNSFRFVIPLLQIILWHFRFILQPLGVPDLWFWEQMVISCKMKVISRTIWGLCCKGHFQNVFLWHQRQAITFLF